MKASWNATYVDPGTGLLAPDRTEACLNYLMAHGDHVVFVDLITITFAKLGVPSLITGKLDSPLMLRWATTPYHVPFEGNLYLGGAAGIVDPEGRPVTAPRISRKGLTTAVGTGVTELELTLALDGDELLPPADRWYFAPADWTTPRLGLAEALLTGLFDLARVELRTLVLPDHPKYPIGPVAPGRLGGGDAGTSLANRGDLGPGDLSLGAVHMFLGRITGESELTRSHAVLKVKSYTELLSQVQMPRRILQPGCLWTLYDQGCGVSRLGTSPGGVPFQVNGTITDVLDPQVFTIDCGATITPNAWFVNGSLTFLAGSPLCGLSLAVTRWAPLPSLAVGYVTTLLRPPRVPQVGDTVCLQAGCNKVGLMENPSDGSIVSNDPRADCEFKFNNLPRFLGLPHVAVPETAY